VLIRFGECVSEIALDIEFSHKSFLRQDGYNDFALHHGRSLKITRIFRDIVHYYCLSTASCGTTESGVEGNPSIRGKTPCKWSYQEDARIRGVDKIKPYPVVASHLFV